MKRAEYMRIPLCFIPADIRETYNLDSNAHTDGYVYVEIMKGMYGLKQAAVLAYNNLVKNLAPHGYKPSRHSTGLWYHETRKTNFCFCVDDFWVKYFKPEDAQHLLDTLELFYTISVDMEGRNYCGLTIDWNYSKGYVDISMSGYILKVLHKLQHPTPSRPQYSPHQWNRPIYGKTRQFAPLPDESSRLDKSGIKRVQTAVPAIRLLAPGRTR
jgi:hypothetical protein